MNIRRRSSIMPIMTGFIADFLSETTENGYLFGENHIPCSCFGLVKHVCLEIYLVKVQLVLIDYSINSCVTRLGGFNKFTNSVAKGSLLL
jgi:hypothetical protein